MADVTASACVAPLYRGPHKGQPATGTEAGYLRHRRAGEAACDPCRRAVLAAQQARGYDPERHGQATRRWYENNRDRHLANTKRWQRENREAERERCRRNRERDRERWREYHRRWRAENPASVATSKARRRMREDAAPTIPFTSEQLTQRMSMFAGCWMCGDPAADTIDHVKPLAAGGWHCLSNLRPACRACNCRKRDIWPFHPDMAA